MIIRSGAKKTFRLIKSLVLLGNGPIISLVLVCLPCTYRAFLVLEISGLIQFHWALARSLDSQCFCILPTYWSLLPHSKCQSIARISLLIHRVLAFLLSFLFFGMDCFWAWQRWTLNIKLLSWVSHPSKTLPHSILPNWSLKRAKFLCWSPGFWTQFSSPPLRILNFTISWSLPPRLPLTFTSQQAPPCWYEVQQITCSCWLLYLSEEEVIHNTLQCLDCLCLAVLSLQPMLGVVEAPHEDQGLRTWGCFHLFVQGLIELLFLVRWPMAGTQYNITFTCPLLNPNPYVLISLLIHPTELHTHHLPSHIMENSPSSPHPS